MDKEIYSNHGNRKNSRRNSFQSMAITRHLFGFIARAITAGLAIAFIIMYLWPSLAQRLNGTADQPNLPAESAPASYADAVDRTAPAVVSIYTRTLTPQSVDLQTQRRLGNRSLYRLRQEMGSGVLISEDGYILTNHHVILNARNIRVALWDGRFASARVVGSDPETDLAVLKVDVNGLLAAPIAETTRPRVGDVVLAIGNALGLSHTVTMGIISATGRNDLGSLLYEDFIQTDAAINSGNSGGALINTEGELIGINTRNLGAIQGAQNIGFAIPISIAQNVMEQIIEYGSVRRGWLGAYFTDVPPTALPDGSSARQGIHVRLVSKGGPAWNTGIRQGDVILSLDGEPVDDARAFLLIISQFLPGTEIELEVRRRQEVFETYATLIQQPPLQ
jgi:serine peptidase DegS